MKLRAAVALVVAVLPGCGRSGSSTPTTPNGNPTETFMGTSSVSATGGCSSTNMGHAFNSGEGTIVITLVQSTDNATVATQVCHPTATAHDSQCTVPPFSRIGVGQSTQAVLKGGRAQVLTVYPGTCGQAGTFPATTISYTVTVQHPR
jgi:hypothetical protein